MKTALITGIAGQDGCYLAKLLLSKNYNVYGLSKQRTPLDNLRKLGIKDGVTIIEGDVTDVSSVNMALKVSRPDEIYSLAAQSHVGYSFKTPQQTCAVNFTGYLNVLYGARSIVPHARIYQASTSEMFGYAAGNIANESTPFQPMSPYAIAKTAAHWAGVNARNEAEQFVANGILFNHESPLRGPDFVTRKITLAKARGEKVKLGNVEARRDWGFAGDYVEGMWMMLQHDKPDDFVLATGVSHSVKDFCEAAGVEYEITSDNIRPNDLNFLCGDARKAREVLGWKPKVGFKQLVEMMVEADLHG